METSGPSNPIWRIQMPQGHYVVTDTVTFVQADALATWNLAKSIAVGVDCRLRKSIDAVVANISNQNDGIEWSDEDAN